MSTNQTISITGDHLDGNQPPGLNHERWIAHLRAEYTRIALAHFPEANVHVVINRRRKTSGMPSSLSVSTAGVSAAQERELEEALANAGPDQSANEFYEVSEGQQQ